MARVLSAATAAMAVLFGFYAATRERAGAALGVLIASMLLWPEAWRVPMGLMQMSVPRLVATVLLVRFLLAGRHARIVPNSVDALVVAGWAWTSLATAAVGAEFGQVAQMIGRGFDTVLIYFTARLALVESRELLALIPGLAIAAVTMCVLGIFEAVTFISPHHDLLGSRLQGGVSTGAGYDAERHGLMRARGSTSISIFFGMAMMLVLGLLWSVRGYVTAVLRFRLVLLAALLAALSSMSSGPWIACFLLLALQFYGSRPQLIKPSLQVGVVGIVLIEIASNRHFYELIDHFALDSQTAWYRTRLLEVAFSQWRDFWLLGVGSNWPHHWAALVDGRASIDVVNHYVILALYGGLPGTGMYILAHGLVVRRSVLAWRAAKDDSRRKLLFGLASTLLALDFSSMSVGLFGPALLLSHVLVGALVSVSAWAESPVEMVPESRSAEGLPTHSPLRSHVYVD